MRKFCFLAVAAAVLAMATADAQAGGRRTRYYSYGGTSAVAPQRSTSQAAQPSTATRRYSYSPSTNGSAVRYSYSPGYNTNRQPSWRADRKILGMGY